MNNPISTLLASGYAASLLAACSPGEGYVFSAGTRFSTGAATHDAEGAFKVLVDAASGLPGTIGLWCTASSDGRRLGGDVVLRLPGDGTTITWDLSDGAATLRLAHERRATFGSMTDIAEAVIDANAMLEAFGVDAREIGPALTSLRYRLDWHPADGANQTIESIDLVAA